MERFRINVPEAELDDLRNRLRRTRWADAETVDDWSQGVPLSYLKDLFVHVRAQRPEAMPLVLTHGWPGSMIEFVKVIPALSEDFHVVVPSLPGYGFSDRPTDAGWGVERIADAWAELMARLGYERFGAAGSDWGTSVSALIGQR